MCEAESCLTATGMVGQAFVRGYWKLHSPLSRAELQLHRHLCDFDHCTIQTSSINRSADLRLIIRLPQTTFALIEPDLPQCDKAELYAE
jgi:hypothetical protein